jgi:3-phenylpropionate/trans-cinnamate dioxygenase ferredoxin component
MTEFPAGSDLPSRDESIDLSGFAANVDAALEVVAGRPSLAAAVRDALRNVSAAASRAASDLRPSLSSTQLADGDERAAFLRQAPQHLSEDELANFAIYDRYFDVRRVGGLSSRALTVTALDTWSVALEDLANLLVGRDEIAALLRACRAMLTRLASVAAGTRIPLGDVAAGTQLPQDEVARVLLRWRTGHHVYALCAMHARDALLAGDFVTAAPFVRALPAAQWYTSEFPIRTYLDVLRPTMEQAGARGGFSGTQNADYMRLSWTRERAVEALFEKYGGDAAAWPVQIYSDLMAFNEMEIEAAEHHVLVAASKVQLDGSLAQKAAGDRNAAVRLLREKVDATASDIVERFSSDAVRRVRACALADIPLERPLGVRIDGREIVLCHAYGAVWACDGICTHAGSELEGGHMAGNAIVCPAHGAKFDPRTGAVERGPAPEPLRPYVVVIEGGNVFLEMPA